MKKFRVRLTRDCSFTQSADVEVEASSRTTAWKLASRLRQEELDWLDDDESFYFGEEGTYVADPRAIEEV